MSITVTRDPGCGSLDAHEASGLPLDYPLFPRRQEMTMGRTPLFAGELTAPHLDLGE